MNDLKTFETNIFNVYLQSTEEDRAEGLSWYQITALDLHALASKLDVPFMTLCGVVAALSPGVRWSRNIYWAEQLVRYPDEVMNGVLKIPTYSFLNVTKAKRIIDGENPLTVLSGPKVRAFYHCLITAGQTTEVCIDGHAYSIALGRRLGVRSSSSKLDRAKIRLSDLPIIRQAYRNVAKKLDITAPQLQATTWVTWRRIHGVD
jgi:hypothetical protein